MTTSFLTQRDIALNTSIDQQIIPGINLQSVLFQPNGVTSSSLGILKTILGVGYRSLYIDLYWNADNQTFQLCPGPIPNDGSSEVFNVKFNNQTIQCQGNVTVNSVLEVVMDRLEITDTTLLVNILNVAFNLHIMGNSTSDKASGSYSLSSLVEGIFGTRLYTPQNLQTDRDQGLTFDHLLQPSNTGYPTLVYFLLAERKRVIISARNVSLPSFDGTSASYNISQDQDNIFVIGSNEWNNQIGIDNTVVYTNSTPICTFNNSNQVLGEINNSSMQSLWTTIMDTNDTPFTNDSISDFVQCGFTPVINSAVSTVSELITLLSYADWAWAPGQPSSQNQTSTSSNQLLAWSCAVLDIDGWRVANCYDQFYPLCKSSDNWIIGNTAQNYFDVTCPQNTTFTVQSTALQNTDAILSVNETSSPVFPLWVNLNDISMSECWVTGGKDAVCPYNSSAYNRNQITLLGVAAGMALFLIVLTLVIKTDKVPTRTHQGRWRRLINKFYQEHEYQGVPA